ncbi:diaminobutyrate aminotransferase apoenzyme [Pseudomonas syringae]|uniref:diaminobutyrate--2-oxoglutarate transaminase n=1 Tax=Pseudomonas syringae TaxID=317 RepID=UPI00089D9285|nr:diaminobutyrate--2-oxoglutarate transaminase [Pseudomonas syringae]SDX04205.1 diaminobutyrate aminotransferase apoenzyme [Pseudomonas syringae]SFM16689.1 diaminobutyrate aminotransferase apoenzyme [Pseudomonas syringae]
MNPSLAIYERESNVRSYCRDCNVVFSTAEGATIKDVDGRLFIDFFAGAGSLNYGHNNPRLKKELLDYVREDGITTTLDFHSAAKSRFIEHFDRIILRPRGMDYKLQFSGPTGTNAVEAALKLARKITGRTAVAAFTHAFHGVTLGSLAVTANADKRAAAGVELSNVIRLPYDGFLGPDIDSAEIIEMIFAAGTGFEPPAAVILEVVQGEGGLNCARPHWLQAIQRLCKASGALLIIDDIQAGCGRTGTFFSFESADISPDIICLSKSISGYGLPMSLVLIKPEHDQWAPGEHNGTFRGNNTAFVTATAALSYWQDNAFERSIADRSGLLRAALENLIARTPREAVSIVGRGLFMGLKFGDSRRASMLSAECLSKGLLVETCGPFNEVLKLMPPLTIDLLTLERGLDILKLAYLSTLDNESSRGIA